jgi:hypothetical protein
MRSRFKLGRERPATIIYPKFRMVGKARPFRVFIHPRVLINLFKWLKTYTLIYAKENRI